MQPDCAEFARAAAKAGACAAVVTASTERFAAILGADVAGYSRLIGAGKKGSLAPPTVDPEIVELVRFLCCSKVRASPVGRADPEAAPPGSQL